MKRLALCLMVFALLAVNPAMAAGANGAGKEPATPTSPAEPNSTAAPAAPASPAEARMESELRELRDLLAVQGRQFQEQNEQLKAQLREQQQKMQLLEERLSLARTGSSAGVMAAAVPTAAIGPSAGPVNTSVAGEPGSPVPQKADDAPTALRIKGITLTPGGYMAAETAWRQRALSADVNTPFNSVPLPGSSQSHISEFNASGRQSRISMLAEGKLDHAKIGGYYEADFLSSGTTSNGNQSNSYTFRQRQFWAQAALDSGWTFTGGQMWSLVTETKKGVDNRTEAPPMVIDAQYNVGFSWARQYGFRAAKNFNNKLWLAFSVENPQTTFAAHGQSANFLLGAAGSGGGLLNATTNYSFNAAPDFVLKAAYEPGWGHFELFGVVSTFRDRVFPNAPSTDGAFNDKRVGGGIGANARVQLFARRLDVGLHFLGGSGVGRYGSAGLPDATVRPNGTLALVRSFQSLGTIEWHGPNYDIYTNVGGEFTARTAYATSSTTAVGYGSPLFNNSGCWTEVAPGSSGFSPGSLANCTGDTRDVIEGTLGFWYRFYKGSKGTVQWGPQYSYVVRNTWSGVGSTANPNGQPAGSESMLLTSFRYVLP